VKHWKKIFFFVTKAGTMTRIAAAVGFRFLLLTGLVLTAESFSVHVSSQRPASLSVLPVVVSANDFEEQQKF
jgi:hypothetical protein